MQLTTLSSSSTTNALLSTYQWGTQNGQGVNLTYSFPTTGAWWSTVYTSNPDSEVSLGWSGLTLTQQDNFKSALSLWSEFANLNFTQVTENGSSTSIGDIRVAFSNAVATKGFDGWAYFPPTTTSSMAGDVWFNPSTTVFSPGSQGFDLMMHELGHALGLKHPFDTIGPTNTNPAGNTATLAGAEDSNQYTIMSYNDYDGAGYIYTATGANSYSFYKVQSSTPMLYDIAAIQYLYGANMTTRAGNDVYTFSNTHGELKTIWDAGGVDTFDLSNQTVDQSINLNAGQFSSLGVKQIAFNGPLVSATANIAIAYNAHIENAIGGAGNDTISGNELKNALSGGSGNDTMMGDAGDDTLAGGDGDDILNGGLGDDKLNGGAGNDNLNGGAGNDVYVVNSSLDVVTEQLSAGFDAVQSYINWTLGSNVERLTLVGNAAINGTGNDLGNIITGNGAKNTLNGGLGNDKLIGGAGADTLIGGAGRDVFVFNSTVGVDKINDFYVPRDTIQLQQVVFNAFTNTGVIAADQLVFGNIAADNNDFLIFNKSNGALFYDEDGNGAVPQIQIATLGVNLALTNADFVVA